MNEDYIEGEDSQSLEKRKNGVQPAKLEEVMVRPDMPGQNGTPADPLFDFPTTQEEWPVRTILDEEEVAALMEIRSVDLALGEDEDWQELAHLYSALKVSLGGRGRDDYKEAITGMRMVSSVENVFARMAQLNRNGNSSSQ